MKTRIIISIALGFVVFLSSLFSYKVYENFRRITEEQAGLERKRHAWLVLKNNLEKRIKDFKGTAGIVIEDLDTNWQISFNKDELMPSASLVKIPIMLSCFYAANDGKITLQDPVTLRRTDKVSGSKALGDDPVGSVFTVEELIEPMITLSDNAAANTLIDFMSLDTYNAYFGKIGLKNTNLARKMMDFEGRRAGEENYTTALDMAHLLEKLYYNKFLNPGVSEKCLGILRQQKINDRIPRRLPRGTVVAHKTGLERHVCHDVGIVYTDNGNFLICVLAKHNNRYAQPAKKFISDIALLTYNYYQNLN